MLRIKRDLIVSFGKIPCHVEFVRFGIECRSILELANYHCRNNKYEKFLYLYGKNKIVFGRTIGSYDSAGRMYPLTIFRYVHFCCKWNFIEIVPALYANYLCSVDDLLQNCVSYRSLSAFMRELKRIAGLNRNFTQQDLIFAKATIEAQ
ncbi:MAG: hypothetical protein JXR42_03610 [Gammaproteobacteria bacterium]|nr:hypothetical protein [Gammaproteobacteria bacterium]